MFMMELCPQSIKFKLQNEIDTTNEKSAKSMDQVVNPLGIFRLSKHALHQNQMRQIKMKVATAIAPPIQNIFLLKKIASQITPSSSEPGLEMTILCWVPIFPPPQLSDCKA